MYSQLIINILISFSIYLVISLSFSLIYSTTKFFNFSHASILTIIGYTYYFLHYQIHFPIIISVFASILISSSFGMIFEIGIFRRLRDKNKSSLVMLVTSVGLYIIIQNLISLTWGDDAKSIRLANPKMGINIYGAYITKIQLVIIISCIVLFTITTSILNYSRIGKKFYAISNNSELANINGIDSNIIILFYCGIGSFIASIIGLLVALDTSLSPTIGFNLFLYGVIALIIGGVGSTWGLIGGSLLLATAQHIGAYYIDNKWMDAIAYIILILFLIWKPRGFGGNRLKKVEI